LSTYRQWWARVPEFAFPRARVPAFLPFLERGTVGKQNFYRNAGTGNAKFRNANFRVPGVLFRVANEVLFRYFSVNKWLVVLLLSLLLPILLLKVVLLNLVLLLIVILLVVFFSLHYRYFLSYSFWSYSSSSYYFLSSYFLSSTFSYSFLLYS